MKHTFYILIWLASLLSLNACTQQRNFNALLAQVDSLMEDYPDSALHILEDINPQRLRTQTEHAYYSLLMTQARDKMYIVQTDDSLIRIAVQYYDSIGDASMQARAYYYKGCVYRDANLCGEAVREYLTAAPLAEKAGNQKLLGLIYNHTGYLCYLQDLMVEADSIYQKTEEIAIQQNDTSLWAEALSFQGKINIKKGRKYYPDAEERLLKAFEITSNPNYKLVQADVAASLSRLYNRMNQSEKAIEFAKQNIVLRDDNARCYKAFSILANAYFNAEQYDSATLYINKSMQSEIYDIKANGYILLAAIAKSQGNLDKSLALTEKHLLYVDSIKLSHQSNDILNAEKEMERQQYAKSIDRHYNIHAIFIIVSVVSVCIIGIVCFLLKKYRRDTHTLKQKKAYLEHEQQELQKKYIQLKSQLTQKDSEIASLKDNIRQQEISETKKEKLQQELEKFNSEREALAKETFEHSKIYAKMERIIESCRKYDKSNEKLNDDDWKYLIAETDMRWNGAITRLSAQHQLTKKEIHLCCLYLTDIPLVSFEYLIEYRRSSIYRKEKDILEMMGYSSQTCKLKDVLKKC